MLKCTGYHGTTQDNVESIKANGFRLSGEKEWMGSGVYFFGDAQPLTYGKDEARSWVVSVRKQSNWAVFKVEIESDNYLDIAADKSHRALYDEIKNQLMEIHRQREAIQTFNEQWIFTAIAKRDDLDVIRGCFNARREDGYMRKLVQHPQVQICVKKVDCIKSTTLLKEGSSNVNG